MLYLRVPCHSIRTTAREPSNITKRIYRSSMLKKDNSIQNEWDQFSKASSYLFIYVLVQISAIKPVLKEKLNSYLMKVKDRNFPDINLRIKDFYFPKYSKLYLVQSCNLNGSCQGSVKGSTSAKLLFNNIDCCVNNIFPIVIFSCRHDSSVARHYTIFLWW